MKAAIVLVGDTDAQNYGAKTMLNAHELGGTGFEAARLPFHVSLKQTFFISDRAEFEKFFDEFAATVEPVAVPFEECWVMPNTSLGGAESGCLALKARRTPQLESLQKRLFGALTERFGPCPSEHDNDYIFHMTLAIGGAPYENYVCAYEGLKNSAVPSELRFDKLAFFYYDDDSIAKGTYFCYKCHDLI